jgi:hypothetical protein
MHTYSIDEAHVGEWHRDVNMSASAFNKFARETPMVRLAKAP